MKSFSWKTIQNKLKSMNRTDWLIVLLLGILLLVIAIPSGEEGMGKDESSYSNEQEADSGTMDAKSKSGADENAQYKEQLEKELEELLSQMEGVGKVRVMLTLKDSGAHVLDKNVKRDGDSNETSTVVYNKKDGDEPYVTNQFSPDVKGVFIVAQGGGNAVIVSNISDAVMALFDIEAHKIKIVKMSD